jgi:sulfur carrier protein
VQVTINGAAHQVPDDATLDAVLTDLEVPARGVAVAVDAVVVPRNVWPATSLRPDAVIEVLSAVQGG